MAETNFNQELYNPDSHEEVAERLDNEANRRLNYLSNETHQNIANHAALQRYYIWRDGGQNRDNVIGAEARNLHGTFNASPLDVLQNDIVTGNPLNWTEQQKKDYLSDNFEMQQEINRSLNFMEYRAAYQRGEPGAMKFVQIVSSDYYDQFSKMRRLYQEEERKE
jgi:hypothetical protein